MLIRRLRVALVLLLLSSGYFSHAFEALPLRINCVNVNEDLALIADLSESGQLRREARKFVVKAFDYNEDKPFSDYLAYAREKILAENPKAEMLCPITTPTSQLLYPELDNDLQQVVDLVAPFELARPNADSVVLLIHGLTDSPFLFHDMAHEFFQNGLDVRTLLLPGHGTAPSALIETNERKWRQATRYAIRQALKDYKRVYLGGFSTGGTLIWDQLNTGTWSQTELAKIAGLMMWAPASKAKSDMAWVAKYVDYLPFVDWLNKGADIDFAKYESFPFNAAAQVHTLMSRVNGNSKSLTRIPDIPLLVVASEVDQTIETKTTLSLMRQWHNAPGRMSQSLDTLIFYGNEAVVAQLPDSLAVLRPACQNQQLCDKVIDISHNAALNAPTNPHYGYQGNYKYCEHHIGSDAFSACKTMAVVPTGEISGRNLDKYGVMRRLTFNPYFDHMREQVLGFVTKTGIKP